MSATRDEAPVLIAGAGPVGMASALLLARWGVPSTLLEPQSAHDPSGSKAICVQRDVLDVFDRIGCAEAMVARGVTWQLGRTFYRDRELFQTTFPDPGRSAFPPFVNIGQGEVEQFMWERIANEPLVTVCRDHRVVGLRQDERGVVVDCATPDGTRAIAGAYLVGADGSRSAVRKLLGLGFGGHSFADQFLIADIRAELPYASERRFFFDPAWNPGRQVLLHPQPDSVWRIDWQVPGETDLAGEIASGELDRRVRTVIGDRDYELVWVSAYRFHQRVADAFRLGRVLLAGDAAHVMSPFGARGMNSGMQDAENLAWKLAFVLRSHAPASLLETYQTERMAAARENLRVTGDTMRFLVPQDEREWRRRTALLERAVDDESARGLVDSGKLAEPFWYVDSPLTTAPEGVQAEPFPTAPGALRPPAPGVLCPDGPCAPAGGARRLRALLGHGVVVLLADTPSADADALAKAAAAATTAPLNCHRLADLDRHGVLTPALRATPGAALVIRPDGHLAAVLTAATPATLTAAVTRSLGG